MLAVRVKSQDGSTESTYLVTVHRVSNIASLAALSCTGGALVPVVGVAGAYSVSVPASTDRVSVTCPASSALAQRSYAFTPGAASVDLSILRWKALSASFIPDSDLPLPEGDSVLVIRVVAEDRATASHTTIRMHRRSAEARLASRSPPGAWRPCWPSIPT